MPANDNHDVVDGVELIDLRGMKLSSPWPEWLKIATIIASSFLWLGLIYLVLIAID